MTSCLRKLVHVCLAVIAMTAFSHRIAYLNIEQLWRAIFHMKIGLSDN